MRIEELQGHWRRSWLKAPGVLDRDTCVHWMQCGSLYADIRVPATRPDTRGARALADLPDKVLLSLMEAEGFAGEIDLTGDVCTWKREINWHGTTELVDAGRLAFDGPDVLTEIGVHAAYSERWERRDEAADGAMALSGPDGSTGVLVSVGKSFVFGLGTSGARPSKAARAALMVGERGDAVAHHFDGLYVFGHWQGDRGVAVRSTNPLLEGHGVLTCNRNGAVLHVADFYGEGRDIRLQPTRVMESEFV